MSIETKPSFASAARIIADGKPPPWLMVGLEQFGLFIGIDRLTSREDTELRAILQKMHDAADLLEKRLPAMVLSPAGIGSGEDVRAALGALPSIKKDLARALQKPRSGGGPRPNIQRQFCAPVVVEACKLLHGKVLPRDKLADACNEYWQACGGEFRGDEDYAGAWRRDIGQAISANQSVIRDVLIAVRNSHSIA